MFLSKEVLFGDRDKAAPHLRGIISSLHFWGGMHFQAKLVKNQHLHNLLWKLLHRFQLRSHLYHQILVVGGQNTHTGALKLQKLTMQEWTMTGEIAGWTLQEWTISIPAKSTPAISSVTVHSCNVHPRFIIHRQCPFMQFQSTDAHNKSRWRTAAILKKIEKSPYTATV